MATSRSTEKSLRSASYYSQLFWWNPPWMENADLVVQLQCIWLDTCSDAARHEIEFLSTMATSYSKLAECMLGIGGRQYTPESMASCYQEIASDMTDAALQRMRRTSELSDEFRERIWCEI